MIFHSLLYYLKELRFRLIRKYRREEARREKFYATFVKPGDLCFDVGANIGNMTASLLNIGAKIVAIEPLKSGCHYLKKKFGQKIEIVPKGLGEKEEERDFYISRVSVLSSFSSDWIRAVKESKFRNITWLKARKKEITTLDRLIEKYGTPSFIKIDVEGFELEVLRGLSTPVSHISFEYTVPEQIDRVPRCIGQIEKIMPDFVCNYSIGESLKFVLDEWISSEEMKKFVLTDEFIGSGVGDVYVRSKVQ